MIILAVALAMTTLSGQAPVADPAIFVLTNAEKASGFATLGECERALGPAKRPSEARGSLFNRNAGNISRCEIVHGEPMVVVYPKGYAAAR